MYSSSKQRPIQHEKMPVSTTDVRYANPMNGNTTSFNVGSPKSPMTSGCSGSNAVVKFKNIPKKIEKQSPYDHHSYYIIAMLSLNLVPTINEMHQLHLPRIARLMPRTAPPNIKCIAK